MNCKTCQAALPDLMFEASAPANTAALHHISACEPCAAEFRELKATFALLDAWEAPEISPYFDQKLHVLLREEQAAPSAGWFELWKTRLLLNTGRQFRPAMAAAMAVVLLIGGGSVGMSTFSHVSQVKVQASATVNDLQILDRNEQALQEMDQLLQDDADADAAPATPPS